MPIKKKYLLFSLLLFIGQLGFSQHYIGIGTSFHFTSIVNSNYKFYLPDNNTHSGAFSVTSKRTPRYSLSLNYGKQLSPSFIFFTGFQHIGFGQKFDIERNTIDFSGLQTQMVKELYISDLKLNYIKLPVKLYWKHAKYKAFGTFLSFSFDFGYLFSAKLEQNSVVYDYYNEVNQFDINYTLSFGIRYDTEKTMFSLGIAGGDGLSDVENQEKFGVTIPDPAVNSFLGIFGTYSIKIYTPRSSQ